MNDQERSWKITGVRVIDPFTRTEETTDVFIVGGRFADKGSAKECSAVDGQGLWLVPDLTDMHVHFRAPGQEWKEDLASGSAAAAAGGFSAVATMPNTVPVVDTASLVRWQVLEGERIGLVDIVPIGAVSKGSKGEELAELFEMEAAGAGGFSDDGRPVVNSRLMRAALSYSRTLRAAIIQHAEDPGLSAGAVMHEGAVSGRLGLPGAPGVAEAAMVWRDVELAALTGGRLHVAHVSVQETLEALAWARERTLAVTAEVTPHHLYFTDERVASPRFDPSTKVNPPLRPEAHRRALIAAVKSGLIGVIASDHAPHHRDEKDAPYVDAPFGISGLETSVGAVMTVLLGEGAMTPLDLFERMTVAPRRLLGLSPGGVRPEQAADFALIDPKAVWTVDPDRFYSRGKNTPFAGERLTGRVVATMRHGRFVMREGEVIGCAAS